VCASKLPSQQHVDCHGTRFRKESHHRGNTSMCSPLEVSFTLSVLYTLPFPTGSPTLSISLNVFSIHLTLPFLHNNRCNPTQYRQQTTDNPQPYVTPSFSLHCNYCPLSLHVLKLYLFIKHQHSMFRKTLWLCGPVPSVRDQQLLITVRFSVRTKMQTYHCHPLERKNRYYWLAL